MLANGPENAPVKRRGSRTLMDAASRAYRSWTIAQDSSGGGLHGATEIDDLNWSVSATQLNARGQAEKAWTLTPEDGPAQSQYFKYDGRGMVLDSLGLVTDENISHAKFKYDAAGNCIYGETPVVESNGWCASSIQQITYDPCDRPWKVFTKWQGSMQTSPENVATTEYRRNNLGWPELVIDGAGRQTKTEYNFAGLPRRISVLEQQGGATSITERKYYRNGTLEKEIAYRADNPQGLGSATLQTTTYFYDAKDRLTKVDRAGVGEWRYVYNALDLLCFEFRPDGTKIENHYNNGGDLTWRAIYQFSQSASATSSPSSPPKVGSEHYGVNEFGEITSAITKDAAGTPTTELTMDYNSLGEIEKQTLTVYDAQDQALAPYFIEHNWDKSKLGFESLYESVARGYSSWPMTVKYDCLGREMEQAFWDSRTVVSKYSKLLETESRDTTLGQSIPLVKYTYVDQLLLGREYHRNEENSSVYHVRSMRPSQPGLQVCASSSLGYSDSVFDADPHGGLAEVEHRQGGALSDSFAHTQTRYDKSGNPVLECSVHRGGLTRVMKYDHSNRLATSYHGHLIKVTDPSPDLLLDPSSPHLTPSDAHWKRDYAQDTLDNITKIDDLIESKSSSIDMPVVSGTENLVKSLGGSGTFGYDACKSLETDPTTGLTYKYNYRGQLETVTRGSGTNAVVVRQCIYDCFGRMVHQVEAPGTVAERGTIFVPNVGFGGGGEGADYAAEITYERDGTVLRGREVVQYTYGIGAMGDGLGRKRLVEFVAYCSEFAPYYRFLHEDTQQHDRDHFALG